MTAQAELQAFLRFLSQDAKIPLAIALGKVKQLQAAGLGDASVIAAAKPAEVRKVFDGDGEAAEKLAKQLHQAAKRSAKRKASDDTTAESTTPRKKAKRIDATASPADIEASLALPEASTDTDAIQKAIIVTNRAPLVLAFAVSLLKYTMPEQPLSSRLSLAQAVVSMNSKSKAVSLGIDSGKTAEDEGWGTGQPGVRVMSREIKVLKRWGYDPRATISESGGAMVEEDDNKSKGLLEAKKEEENKEEEEEGEKDPALWGLDLEALKKTNGPGSDRSKHNLPIHTPDAARAYLLKSFGSPTTTSGPKPSTAKTVSEEKEKNLGLLLGALEAVYESWASLDPRELDRRAWSWYVKIRPDVDHGPSGWGGKGEVPLKAILDLRKPC